MKFLNSLILLALLGVLFSCGGDDSDDIMNSDPLVGEWRMVSLDYSGTSTTINPYGPPLVSEFVGTARDINTTITFNSDNTFSSEGAYTIDLVTDYGGTTFEESTEFEGFMGSGTWALDGNTLTTTDNATGETSELDLQNLTDDGWGVDVMNSRTTEVQGFTVIQEVNTSFFFER